MKKGLVDSVKDVTNKTFKTIAELTDWKRVGKVVLVFIPIILFTAFYWVMKYLWKGTEYINQKGDKFLEQFLND